MNGRGACAGSVARLALACVGAAWNSQAPGWRWRQAGRAAGEGDFSPAGARRARPPNRRPRAPRAPAMASGQAPEPGCPIGGAPGGPAAARGGRAPGARAPPGPSGLARALASRPIPLAPPCRAGRGAPPSPPAPGPPPPRPRRAMAPAALRRGARARALAACPPAPRPPAPNPQPPMACPAAPPAPGCQLIPARPGACDDGALWQRQQQRRWGQID
jgi:hypothetical protein